MMKGTVELTAEFHVIGGDILKFEGRAEVAPQPNACAEIWIDSSKSCLYLRDAQKQKAEHEK